MMTKMESPLAPNPICLFAGENVMLHLKSALVVTLRLKESELGSQALKATSATQTHHSQQLLQLHGVENSFF